MWWHCKKCGNEWKSVINVRIKGTVCPVCAEREVLAGYNDLATKAVLAPMKAVKKMLVSMELHLDASIDKLDNLAMNVQLDKEKHMENAKVQEQTEPERAEAERVEAEIVYSPMVAEPQEYQYNADAFEARGVDEVKQEAAHKEVSKVREDKAR